MAASLLAMDHFNARYPVIVQELSSASLSKEVCGVQFSKLGVVDNELDKQAVRANLPVYLKNSEERKCTAVIGSSISSIDLVSYSSSKKFDASFVSPIAQQGGVYNADNAYPSLGQNITYSSKAVFDYMVQIERAYVGVVYADQGFSMSFWRNFDNHARKDDDFYAKGERFNSRKIEGEKSGSINDALWKINKTGYRTIMIVMETDLWLGRIAREAAKLNMVDNYFWVFVIELPLRLQNYDNPELLFADEEWNGIFNGAAFIFSSKSMLHSAGSSSVFQKWSKDNGLIERVQHYLPPNADEGALQSSLFSTTVAPFVYDAVISSGIGACHAQAKQAKGDITNIPGRAITAEISRLEVIGARKQSELLVDHHIGGSQVRVLNTFLIRNESTGLSM